MKYEECDRDKGVRQRKQALKRFAGVGGRASINLIVAAIIMCVLICILTLLSLGGNARFENFDNLEKDYMEMIDVLNSEYSYQKRSSTKEFILVDIINSSELSCNNQPITTLSDKQKESLKRIQEQSYVKYSYIWVSDEYIIFWEDETKQYGLLYAKRPKKIIRSMKKEWYKGMDYNRINRNWYEIGQFGL